MRLNTYINLYSINGVILVKYVVYFSIHHVLRQKNQIGIASAINTIVLLCNNSINNSLVIFTVIFYIAMATRIEKVRGKNFACMQAIKCLCSCYVTVFLIAWISHHDNSRRIMQMTKISMLVIE